MRGRGISSVGGVSMGGGDCRWVYVHVVGIQGDNPTPHSVRDRGRFPHLIMAEKQKK